MIDRVVLHKEIVGPFTGQRFKIRKVRFKEFLSQLGDLPLPMSATVQQALEVVRERVAEKESGLDDKILRFYVGRGVVEPKIWFDAEKSCPPEQIYWEDLGSDLDHIGQEVIAFSYDLVGLKSLDNFFRGSGSSDIGPPGEEIRAETVDAVADGHV